MSAGSTIREIRKRSGLTVAQLARKINTSPSSIVNWENDKVNISTKNFERVLEAMGWTLIARKVNK